MVIKNLPKTSLTSSAEGFPAAMIKKKEAPVVCTRWFYSSHGAISGKDLEQPDKTGEEIFDDFLEDTSLREKCVISGL